VQTAALTALALACFAGNSLLARLALGAEPSAAAAFTAVRLAAGALILGLLAARRPSAGGGWIPPFALFAYALPFSLAYVRIGAGTGALVLFGAVQLTMLAAGLARGERPRPLAWLGLALAVGGLAGLTWRGADRPDLAGSAPMALAGAAWGVYSLAGKSAPDPISANARAFLWSAPLAIVAALAISGTSPPAPRTLLLAAVSGAVTSGLGYAVWYRALKGLSAMRAAVVQLAVPVIAALAAVPLLGEPMTARLALAGSAILGGVALAIAPRPAAGPGGPGGSGPR
jgi:drug/metabolite transporter (DMT)-like permease